LADAGQLRGKIILEIGTWNAEKKGMMELLFFVPPPFHRGFFLSRMDTLPNCCHGVVAGANRR
jgi:hypothetical protein